MNINKGYFKIIAIFICLCVLGLSIKALIIGNWFSFFFLFTLDCQIFVSGVLQLNNRYWRFGSTSVLVLLFIYQLYFHVTLS